MWSNGSMPDVSSDSPEFDPLVVEQALPDGAARWPPRKRVSARVALAVGAALVVTAAAVVVAATADSEDPAGATVDTAPSTAPPATLAPVATSMPFGWSSVDAAEYAVGPVGVADGWVEWPIPLPSPLDGLASPVEVVMLTAGGMLHRIELPGGLMRTRSLPAASTDGQIAVTDHAIAVPQRAGVVIARDDGALVTVALATDRVPRVAGIGTRFLANVERQADRPEQWWIIEPDGSVSDVSDGPFGRFGHWDVHVLRSGEVLADAGDGIYSVRLDGAGDVAVLEVDEGRLVAAGPGRYIASTCDESSPSASTCDYTLVDRSSGERTPARLGVLDAYRFWDTSIRLSPDGRFVQYADWQRQRPRTRIVDLADGAVSDAGALGDVLTPDAWVPDGSGVFVVGDDGIVFRSVDGRAAAIEGLGDVRSVATRAMD
jgi:hypothetical protein